MIESETGRIKISARPNWRVIYALNAR
jgi:hypothetical protein